MHPNEFCLLVLYSIPHVNSLCLSPQILNALKNMQNFQEYFTKIVQAKFCGANRVSYGQLENREYCGFSCVLSGWFSLATESDLSRSGRRVYDLVKIGIRSRKKVMSSTESESDRTFPFQPIPFTTPSLNQFVGVRGGSGRTNQSQCPESSIVIGLFFRFCLRLRHDARVFT